MVRQFANRWSIHRCAFDDRSVSGVRRYDPSRKPCNRPTQYISEFSQAHTGEVWSGTLTHDIVEHGKVVARAGSPVKGKVTYVNRSGRLHKPGALTLRLTSINGETVYSSRVSRQGKSHTKSNVTKIGGGAGAGALIGAVAGGGKGAAIGAGAGAAAGTGVAAATGKQEVRIPAESVLTFTITGSK